MTGALTESTFRRRRGPSIAAAAEAVRRSAPEVILVAPLAAQSSLSRSQEQCHACGEDVELGPRQYEQRHALRQAGSAVRVLCKGCVGFTDTACHGP